MAKKKGKKLPVKNKPAAGVDTTNEALASALSSANTVLMKVCRLCETKDGPFLNIFDAEQFTAKKITDLMPFVVAENDDLPHKICFRCSAKVEELFEFIHKCVKTQHNLLRSIGKNIAMVPKNKDRVLWEEKLNKSTLSNDIICDVIIKRAMESIGDIQLNHLENNEKNIEKKNKTDSVKDVNNEGSKLETNTGTEEMLKKVKLAIEKVDQRGSIVNDSIKNQDNNVCNNTISTQNKPTSLESTESEERSHAVNKSVHENQKVDVVKNKDGPVLNIMDHVSIIKVNNVGILYQCKMCNKNFLKKDVVESHACAKNGAPKIDFTKNIPPPPPPKAPTVKYIKIDGNLKKNKDADTLKPVESKTDKLEVKLPPAAPSKPKPRIGPASRVKRQPSLEVVSENSPIVINAVAPAQQSNQHINAIPNQTPVFTFPTMPKLNSRYSFVPGPNNTFTLVEEQSVPTPSVHNIVPKISITTSETTQPVKKMCTPGPKSKKMQKIHNPEIIELDDDTTPGEPYPVGLFKTDNTAACSQPTNELPAFATPAMKKQMYTVVQTGNPSKLLISSKPQPVQYVDEPVKKRQKRTKEVKDSNEPYRVTLEDKTPAKDPSIFTFINVDPLLQPSYVLPTDSIQESQISTSTQVVQAAEKDEKELSSKAYSCNMCNEKFSREKKLLSHIQTHYNKMDEEDQIREKTKKRKTRS